MTFEARRTPGPGDGDPADDAATARVPADEDTIRLMVGRLARPHPSGGVVVERATVLASGSDSVAMLEWICAHGRAEEALAAPAASGGLHGRRSTERSSAAGRPPLRYVLPAGVL